MSAKQPTNEEIKTALYEAHGFVQQFKQKVGKETQVLPGAASILGISEGALLALIRGDKELEEAQIRAALARTDGNISEASEIVGCARETLSRKINKDKNLKEYQLGCELSLGDVSKATLRDAMKFRNQDGSVPPSSVTAAIYVAKTKLKEDGWSERFEMTGPGGAALEVHTHLYLPDNGREDPPKGEEESGENT